MQGSLGIERMCQLAKVSRAGFYRSLQERTPREEGMEVRSSIQQIALEHRRRYGYRRVTKELRRRGMLVNHKRVARIMREDSLLAIQPKRFLTTTDSNHRLEIYLNLARRMKLTGIDQLWVPESIEKVHDRLQRVQIESLPYEKILEKYDRPSSLFYLDPPYWERHLYKFNFSRDDFVALEQRLRTLKGKFILSINDEPEVRKLFRSFRIRTIKLAYTGTDHQTHIKLAGNITLSDLPT